MTFAPGRRFPSTVPVALFWLLFGCAAYAQEGQPELDLNRRAVGVSDSGYFVGTWFNDAGQMQTEIETGEFISHKGFTGPLTLVAERKEESCIFKLVDQVDDPKTEIVMPADNLLSCRASKSIEQKMGSLCKVESK